MFREIESYPPHTELLHKLQNMFPTANITLPTHGASLYDSLDTMIKSIPRPNSRDTTATISNMKSIVDGQELRIQLNMMQLQHADEDSSPPLGKKGSMFTRADPWSEEEGEPMEDWVWKPQNIQYEESLSNEFGSFLD